MFEKFKKKLTSTATISAVENAKETLNDKLETYSGIIKVGLTIIVLGFGAKKIHEHGAAKHGGGTNMVQPSLPQPIIINNYFGDERRQSYGRAQGTNSQKH